MRTKFHLCQQVRHISGSLPGVVVGYVPSIPEYKVESAYEVIWHDGTESIHMESELTTIKAANDDCYEPAC